MHCTGEKSEAKRSKMEQRNEERANDGGRAGGAAGARYVNMTNMTNRIEVRAEVLSLASMSDPMKVVQHVTRLKVLARQMGMWQFFCSERHVEDLAPGMGEMYKRWLIESFACPSTRMILSDANSPHACWRLILSDVLMGTDVSQVLQDWLHSIRWDESTNIISFTCEFRSVLREIDGWDQQDGDDGGDGQVPRALMVPDKLRKQLFIKALPSRYYHLVQMADQRQVQRENADAYIARVARLITNAMAHAMVHHDNGGPIAMYSRAEEQTSEQYQPPS